MARTGGKTTYTREDVIELLAAIEAASDVFLATDVKLSVEARHNEVGIIRQELEYRFLGELVDPGEDSDAYWETDPDEIAMRVRSSEIEAEIIDMAYRAKVRTAEATALLQARDGRSAKLRVFAERLREAGTQKGVYLPTDKEMTERARAAMDAEVTS